MILTYLIKSTLCLGILFGFYKIALENKAMHQFKRFYLLASLVFAFTIPLVTFTYTTTVSQEALEEQWVQGFAQGYEESPASSPQVEQAETDYTNTIIWSLYGLGVLIFGIRFGLNLVRLKRKISTAQLFEERDFTIALLGKAIVPHSFFKWIFLNKTQYLNQEIAPEVIAHEATHVRQKHSWDILFVEFLQVVFWFNPLVWLSNISIKLNHEFLADQGAIIDKSNIAIYQRILLSYASSAHHTALESPFNYSLTKKRIVMLSQSFSRKRAALSALLLVPIIIGCTILFNNQIKAQMRKSPEGKTHPIEGHWIDHGNENKNVFIYTKNDTLWWDQLVQIAPIEIISNEYFLSLGDEKIELSIAENGFLKMGSSIYFTPPEDNISYRIDGIWQGDDTTTSYLFNTKNGNPTCDVTNLETKTTTRFYPKLVNNGMTFNIGRKELRFDLEDSILRMQDGSILKRIKNNSKYEALSERKTAVNQTSILTQQETNPAVIEQPSPIEEQIRSNTNPKKFFRELGENSLRINGEIVPLKDLAKRIDEKTKNWTEEDFQNQKTSEVLLAEMSFSTRIDENFLIAYKEEMSKSNFYKKVGHYGFTTSFPVSFLDSKYEETLKIENYIIYYNDKKVTFKQLQEKLKGHEYYTSRCYNADKTKTPKAYFEPYIPKSPPANSNLSSPFSANKTEQTSKVKQGDTLVITVDERGQKALAVINNATQGTIIDQPAEDPGVDRTALDTYNRLAKKYTANPNGEIKREEIKTMSAIYKLMNVEQKEKATPYPTIPPPPPVQKESKGKKIGDVNTSAKMQSKTLYANNTASTKAVGVLNEQSAATSGQKTKLFNQNLKQFPKPTRLTILDHLRSMNRLEATFIYEGKAVSFKEVMKLARKDRTLDVISYIDEAHTKTTTYLKDKGWKAFFDKEHKLFRQERVTITYKGKTITEDEAKKLICQKPEKVEIKILSQNKKEIEIELIPKTNDADGLGSTKASTMIKNHIKKGGKFRYNDTLISKEEALFIVQQQPTSFLKNANKLEELILIPNPMTDNIDFYFKDKIITKKEALKYSLDRAYRAVPKTVDNHRKPRYDFVKRLKRRDKHISSIFFLVLLDYNIWPL